ncbi:hypothetical protein D8674_041329 [Pyrus ussuriensis x Pyrus communis]|uniref:Uncharacterized protein n=1 Tax=Pyrus ussuriensis x Pyrus communis TaxID=2448454 RepID=A0A5N5G7K8_9ROSA|nr:hypothetical protein D8674_041329 [Pyrus ussuriensis x Pyrus communis]
MFRVTEKIKATRLQLANWAKTTKRLISGEISETKDKLNALFGKPITETTIAQRHELNTRLQALLAQEKAFWRQRQHKNALPGLYDEAGVWHADKRGMEMVIVDYFMKLFDSQGATDVSKIMRVVTPKVTNVMNQKLIQLVFNEEIKGALFQMHSTKAQGPDVRSSEGRFLATQVNRVVVVRLALHAEATAVRAADLFLRICIMKQVQVEGDALLVISAIQNAGATFSGHYGYMFDDTRRLL